MIETSIYYIVIVALASLPLIILWVSLRVLRDAMAWHVEQRLYGVRDQVYDGVGAGRWKFSDRKVEIFIKHVHQLIELTRDANQRHDALKYGIMNDDEKNSPPSEEDQAKFFPYLSDPELGPLAHQLYWHAYKCVIMDCLTKYFPIAFPVFIALAVYYCTSHAAVMVQGAADNFSKRIIGSLDMRMRSPYPV
jgi:hypothetical protein